MHAKPAVRQITTLAVLSWLGLAASALAAPASGAALKPAPLVACASDGQMGLTAPPKRKIATPRLSAGEAQRLAYYASADLGVLAPRGWHCFGLSGSNGSILIVTPERHGSELLDPKISIKGPAVEFIARDGETSGRFDVADAAADLFPAAKDFVRQVAAEGLEPLKPWKPAASDRITSRSADRVEFVTAADREGLGTLGRLAPSRDPIGGAILLEPDDGMGLLVLHVRLAPKDSQVASTIVEQFKAHKGVPSGIGVD
jgi:hypothetical protein